MEIRLLCESEIQMAIGVAYEIYETCVRPYARSPKEAEQFYGYVRMENLMQEVHAGRLMLWGAFEQQDLCGVSAMQSVGHITMLYVKPQYGRRGIGAQLLEHMYHYAASVWHKERVTINVMPMAAASYFYKKGFVQMRNIPWSDSYVSLERSVAAAKPPKPMVTYEAKSVSAKRVVALVVGVLVFSFVVMAGVTVHHMATDGLAQEKETQLE